jgi:hypothetical protein
MPDPTPPTAPPAGTPWHAGIEADTIGWWQNKGLPLDDPKVFAGKLTEQYRNLEKFTGGPPERLIKLPEKPEDTAGWNAVWQRLGAPAKAEDYDFTSVKHVDGKAPEEGLIVAIRNAAMAVHAPKDKAAELANAVVKHLDSVTTERAVATKAALEIERAELLKNWTAAKFEFNRLTAMQGAQRIGITQEDVAKLESVVGYARVMEMFRRIGAATSEDTFVEGRGGGDNTTTTEGARARLNELMADEDWGRRLTKGDAAAVREFNNLTILISSAA